VRVQDGWHLSEYATWSGYGEIGDNTVWSDGGDGEKWEVGNATEDHGTSHY